MLENQRWLLTRPSYRPAGEVIRTSEYEISEFADDQTPKDFIMKHHYAGDYPSARFRFGLHRHGSLVGVAVFSHPVNDKTLTNVFPVHRLEATELGRFVLLDEVPGNGESWFLARCFEQLRRKEVVDKDGVQHRGILGVVSFSDPMPRQAADGRVVLRGHLGTIYQALNGCYLGRGTARTLKLLPDGRIFSERAVQKIRKQEKGWRAAVAELQSYGAGPLDAEPLEWLHRWIPRLTRALPHKGNHKYGWALHKPFRKHLVSGAYPKTLDPQVA